MITPLDILSIESWILIGTALLILRYYIHRKWQFWADLNVPYIPPSFRKFGNIADIFTEELFTTDTKYKKKYGPVWGFYVGLTPNLTICDPDMLRKIMIKEFSSFPNRNTNMLKFNGKEMNNGLTAVTDEQWKRIRTSMTSSFSTSKLKQMNGIIERCVDNTIEAFERKIKTTDGVFSVKEVFSRLSLDIVCSAAFSINVHSQDDTKDEPEIVKHAKALFSSSFRSPIIFFSSLSHTFEKLAIKCNYSLFPRSSMQYFGDLAHHMMMQRRQNPHSFKDRVDFMQLMLDREISEEQKRGGADKGLTKVEISGNAVLLILAGFENTGNTMSFLAHNFAFYPETQVKAQQEIDEMLKAGGKFDYDGMNSLKYLAMCVNETLRLYMPILRNIRTAANDVTINGLTIPKGCPVAIPSYHLAHDPDYWTDPFEFKPERMEDMTRIDPMMFQPFGAGPRNCIAMRFALIEVKLAIAKALHKFSFKPLDDTPKPPLKLTFDLGVRPAEKFQLHVVPRQN